MLVSIIADRNLKNNGMI